MVTASATKVQAQPDLKRTHALFAKYFPTEEAHRRGGQVGRALNARTEFLEGRTARGRKCVQPLTLQPESSAGQNFRWFCEPMKQ